jgi:hypothetical protein
VIFPFVKTGPAALETHPGYVYDEHAAKGIHPVVPLVVHLELAVWHAACVA